MIPWKFLQRKSRRIAMFAPSQDTRITLDCKVSLHENQEDCEVRRETQNALTIWSASCCEKSIHGRITRSVMPAANGSRARGWKICLAGVPAWNDIAVSERCKHRGMSWTESGVLAVATYAENSKQKSNHTPTFHTISWTVGIFFVLQWTGVFTSLVER